MSTENGEQVADGEALPNGGEGGAEAAPAERDYEAEARAEGWVPEAEFRGTKRPTKFLSAQEFVERGEMFEPFRKRVERQVEDRVTKLEKVHQRTIERLTKVHEKELADLRAERREAIKAADPDKVDEIDGRIEALKNEAPDAQPDTTTPYSKLSAPQQKARDEHSARYQNEWKTRQTWWGANEDMRAYAVGISSDLLANNPDITIEDNLARTEQALAKKFPEQFGGKPAANGHAAVDGGGSFNGGPPSGGKSFSNLPPEAKAAWARFPEKVQKEIGGPDKYAKEYFDA